MKHVIAGLISLLLGCAHQAPGASVGAPAGVATDLLNTSAGVVTIKLSQIESHPNFAVAQADTFTYKHDAIDLKLRRVPFINSQQATLYLQNRKVFLDQTFKNNIAPYFGVVEVEPACYALAKTEATENSTSAMTTFFMEFPMANHSVISECIGGPLAGVARYDFFNCHRTHTVYEIRQYRKIDQSAIQLQIDCE